MSCHLCETCCPSCCECHRDGYERGCETVYAERDAAQADRDRLAARVKELEALAEEACIVADNLWARVYSGPTELDEVGASAPTLT